MQMEELTKTQVVLLTLFVSFVTSIATGIVTVTLMEQAPATVTQTINRVVERTVERIVPGETKIKEVPVVTTGEDQVVNAIAQSAPALVRIYAFASDGISTATSTPLLAEQIGVGFLVSKTGLVATAAHLIGDATPAVGITLASGEILLARAVARDATLDLMLLEVATSTRKTFPVLPLAESPVSLGKTAIALVPGDTDLVAMGIVASAQEGNASTTPELTTTISLRGNSPGGPVIDTGGFAIGLMTGEQTSAHVASLRRLLDVWFRSR